MRLAYPNPQTCSCRCSSKRPDTLAASPLLRGGNKAGRGAERDCDQKRNLRVPSLRTRNPTADRAMLQMPPVDTTCMGRHVVPTQRDGDGDEQQQPANCLRNCGRADPSWYARDLALVTARLSSPGRTGTPQAPRHLGRCTSHPGEHPCNKLPSTLFLP
jgi:hypothetical protein